MRIFAFLLVLLGSITACKEKSAEPGEMPTLPSSSIFNLSSQWENQNGDTLHLTDLQGKTLVVVMIYSSCKTACPILIAKMKQIESKFDRKDIDKISMVLVSIDPETDTPEHLKAFATKNGMDGNQWIFLRSDENATREFANVLAMKYKKISPIDFSHSNIISVFKPNGELVKQEEGEINIDNVVTTVNKVVKGNS